MAISSVSYTKTPQAGDDSYWYTEDELLAASNYDSSSNVLTLNVMSNDLGGNAKKLYSIDDGSGALSDLLTSNVTTGWETTLGGNQIRINAGKIEFKFATGLDSLAVGETRHDSFLYAIQLGNGTISYATVTVDVMGSNDGPRVSAAVTAGGNEGGADFEVDLLQGASDIDTGETATLQASGLSFSVNGGPSSSALPAGLTLAGNKLLVDADGSAFDHLAAGASEVITVSYVVVDAHGASVAQTATITITGTNDAPLAVADSAAGTENQLLNIDVLANDTDVDDGHVLSLVSASAPAGMGTASVVGGQLQFDPGTDFDHLAKDAVVHVTLSYTMTDQFGAESSSTVDVTVTGTNDGPVAVADSAAGTENQLLNIDVLANDTDVDDGHVLSLVSASAPVGMGSVSVVDGKVVFNPGTDFDHLAKDAVVHVTLSYTMTDQFGAESSSTVDVTVTGTNDGPVAVADSAAGTENQLLNIDVLANDTDVDDGHVLSLVDASAPAGMGSASVVGGQLQFDPGTDFDHLAKDAVVHVTLSYTMTDQFGAESGSTVDVTVTGTNDGPLAVADTAAGTENQLLNIDVLANDTDVDDGHVLSLVSASAPSGMGSVSVVGGQLQFDPGTDFDHLAEDAVVHVTLSYTMTDQFGAESGSTVDVTVTGTNDGPMAVADSAAGTENQLLNIDVLTNDTDVDDGHVLSLVDASAPAGMGTASVVDGKVVFNPGSDFNHLAKDAVVHVTLSYTMTDQFGAESSSTVDVTVTGTNDAPVAVADSAAGTENQLLNIDVLANDTDVDDDHVLSLVSASAPAGMGTASVVGGQLQFDPGSDFDHLAKDAVVHVTLSYTMTDQFGAESSSTVDVTVTGTNDAPLAVADSAAGTENQLLNIDVLANDTDVDDGHVLSLVDASTPAGMGSASVVGGQLQFDPGTDFDHLAKDAVVHVTLSYTMTDQFGAESSSTVDVTVTGTNDGPLAVADTAAGTENQLLNIDVLANDTDVDDGHVLSLVSASAPAGMGTASVVGGQLQFDPGSDFDHLAKDAVVHVTLSYTMTDQFGAESGSTVDVTVTGTNDGPLAVADSAAGTENQLLNIDVLANDTDVDDGHVLSLVSASAPVGMGSASVVDGKVVFNPGTDFDHLAKDAVVHVTLSYTMTDQFGAESSSTVDVTVTGTNDLASITGTASGGVQEATASSAGVPTTGGVLLLSDVDDGEAVFQQPASLDGVYGSFSLDTGSGVWSYQLDNNRAATQALNSGTTVYDTLLVKSYDGTAQQTITVSIQGATDNSAPQFLSSGVLVSMFEHLLNAATSPTGFASALLGSVLASDADGNALTYSLLSDASGGGFQISAGGAVSVKDLSLLDYESAALIPGGGGARGYALEVAVSDGIAAPVTTTLYVEVKNVTTGLTGGNQTDYLDGGSGGEILIGGGQADVVFGDGGDDSLTGDTGTGAEKADQLFGGAGNDQLFGNGDSDMLRGGSGNDGLTGGTGSDTFVWSLADIAGGPYTDTVKDWGAGGTADKLDLRDLLQGEHANALSLDGYLDFSYASGNTTIAVHSAGAGTAVTQSIVLESIQLAGADDQAIISNLLSSNKLVVDV